MTLFANKLVFKAVEETKPKSSNVIYLGDIKTIYADHKQRTLLVSFQLLRKSTALKAFLRLNSNLLQKGTAGWKTSVKIF